MLAINISTPKSIIQNLKDKFKQKRLSFFKILVKYCIS